MSNPLLSLAPLPGFDVIVPSHVSPAIDELLARCDQALAEATRPGTPASYSHLAQLLDVPLQRLETAWGVVCHLQSVLDTPALREAYAQNLPKVTALFTRLGADERLFAIYKGVAGDDLSTSQRKALSNSLRDFVLSGAELNPLDKERFSETLQRSARLSRDFSNHLLDATDSFVHWATPDELAGVPDDIVSALRHAANEAGREGLKVTLHHPCMAPLMQYAHSRSVREMLYRANATRASELGPAERDNGSLIAEMMCLRQERARLLGHAHHADVSLVPKMAESAAEVEDFLLDLARRCRPQAERDLTELRAFAHTELGLLDLEVWDLAYVSEQLRRARYAFSEQEVKQHFPLDKVLTGLFEIAKTLFDVKVVAEPQAAWHASVTAYRIERDGELLGRFLLDPYARPGKRAGAWMNGAQPRWRQPNGQMRLALAYLVTNFAAPVGDSPCTLSHHEVVTLFHEFGHGLHFLLSHEDVLGVSGISGVEWDAVELPSQLMENFCWEWSVLQHVSAHVETGASLPRELFDKMTAARNFQSGLFLLRQVELALFDMRLHADPLQSSRIQTLMDEIRSEVSLMPPPSYNRFQNSFSHIFAGGYAAGYYSYLWAELLSADAWSVFEEQGALDRRTGQRYFEALLKRGGSRPMRENFEAFVGRPPRIDALLKQRGIAGWS